MEESEGPAGGSNKGSDNKRVAANTGQSAVAVNVFFGGRGCYCMGEIICFL